MTRFWDWLCFEGWVILLLAATWSVLGVTAVLVGALLGGWRP